MLIEHSIKIKELNLSKKDIYISMGYRNDTPDKETIKLIDSTLKEISEITIVRYMYFISEVQILSETDIKIGENIFSLGRKIGPYLEGIQKACLYVSTAGKEFDEYLGNLKKSGDIMKEFIADSIGTVLAELSSSLIANELEKSYNMKVSSPYSPGYCGWDIKEQKKFFSLFPDKPCGITLSDSFLMFPIKSVSGFIGLGNDSFKRPKHCDLCNNLQCFKRRATN
ncbi:vitamin B12 dependent-methionine synthase activation domain-containing protein [Bacteroides xylanisolvens]|uniref:vitamin B12 dependent-methionine synthase activation domain-containing protein n=1 Tax=Bacteroides xylanisolvens TaxID=371601 RepID=UPI00351639B7